MGFEFAFYLTDHRLIALVMVVLFAIACEIGFRVGSRKRDAPESFRSLTSGIGAAYNDGKTGTFTGFEYEYRFSDLFGVGAFLDGTFDGFDLAALGVVANFHPVGRWKVLTGLGVERKTRGTWPTVSNTRLLRCQRPFRPGDSARYRPSAVLGLVSSV